jgi:glutamine synthetase
MPKPIFNDKNLRSISGNDNASGMHTSVSFWNSQGNNKGRRSNLFYDENDDYAELSQTARYFIGGILDHSSLLANRSTVIRVPVDEKNNYKTKRIEYGAPDPSANPYLAFSSIVAAGLDGINKKN